MGKSLKASSEDSSESKNLVSIPHFYVNFLGKTLTVWLSYSYGLDKFPYLTPNGFSMRLIRLEGRVLLQSNYHKQSLFNAKFHNH